MTLFERPLGDRIHRPLLAGLLWAYVTAAAAGVLVALIAGGAYLVGLVTTWFGDATATAPWSLAIDTAAVLAPFVVASSTWAVTYGSSERNTVIRALVGTGAGVAILVVAVRAAAPPLVIAAFATAWSLAIPFERWGRPSYRLAGGVIAVAAAWVVWPDGAGGWWATAAAPLIAATIGPADRLWRAVSGRRS